MLSARRGTRSAVWAGCVLTCSLIAGFHLTAQATDIRGTAARFRWDAFNQSPAPPNSSAPASRSPQPLVRTREALAPLVDARAEVEVVFISLTRMRGALVDLTADGLAVENAAGLHHVSWAEVASIWRPPRNRTRKGFRNGLLTGLVLGVLAWAAQGDCSDPNSNCAQQGATTFADIATITAFFGGAGAAIGRLSSRPPTLVYQAEPVP